VRTLTQKALLNPNVFISYSWTTPDHEEWVVELATRLMHDGINVVLDKWDLKEGQDIFSFMESMVNADSIDKVLVICDKGYMEKANNRVGGVGTETQIITPQIYKDVKQEKFIPIVAERDEYGKTFIPIYMETRLYIDLSSQEGFEDNYDKLIRNIYKVPLYKKPTIGKAPNHLFQDDAPNFKTAYVIRKMKNTIDKYPNRLASMWDEFTELFMESLSEFKIEKVTDASVLDETVVEFIHKTLPLRNDFINALEMVCIAEVLETEQIIEFFEKIYFYSEFQGNGTHYEAQYDHYKFLITELFLYTTTILLKEKKYSFVSELLNADYYVHSEFRGDRTCDYTDFRFYIKSLDYRNQRLKLNRISVHADILMERVVGKYKGELENTDLILYFLSKLNNSQDSKWGGYWFPTAYIYRKESGPIKFLNRLKSKSHFEKVKILFGIDTSNELKSKIEQFESDRGYSNAWNAIPSIKSFIKTEDICTTP
jgi:hypothetical protein